MSLILKFYNSILVRFNLIKLNVFKYKSSSLLLIILSFLNVNIKDNTDLLSEYVSSVFILQIIILLGVINIVLYLLSNYLILKYNIEYKFPKFKFIIK
jgi:hypothetical protein